MAQYKTCEWCGANLDFGESCTCEIKRESENPTGRIINIPVEKLFHHSDNPRKDLGDLTELADSIKAMGVMQNLTVVVNPKEVGTFLVVIGNRRMEASKLAGLAFLPCAVVTMTRETQISTMLLENMQRTDLTVYEQAMGFQMMLDLGESIESIAEKTGFSKSTVRNRIKLTRFDREEMRKAQLRQPTFEQYMRLSEIKDDERANSVLRFIGTKNFDYEVEKAIKVEREENDRRRFREYLETVAEKLADASWETIKAENLITVMNLYVPITEDAKKRVDDAIGTHGKLYWSEGYGFTIYRKSTTEDDAIAEEYDRTRKRRQDLEHRANALYESMTERATKFVLSYRSKKDDFVTLTDFLFFAIVHKLIHPSPLSPAIALGYVLPDGAHSWDNKVEEAAERHIAENYDKDRCRAMLIYLWKTYEFSKPCVLRYNSQKLDNDNGGNWVPMLELLETLGYNVSEEEWSLCKGSHPIFDEEVDL